MVKKWHIVSILLFFLLLVWFVTEQQSTEKSIHIQTPVSDEKSHKRVEKSVKKSPPSRMMKAEQEKSQVMQELSAQNYSADPMAEAVIAATISVDCLTSTYFTDNPLSELQLKALSQFKRSCDQHKNQYPLLTQMMRDNKTRWMREMVAESPFSVIWKKASIMKTGDEALQKQLAEAYISESMRSENAYLISMMLNEMARSLRWYFIHGIAEEMELLNFKYTRMLAGQAVILFSCRYNHAQTCAPTGFYMTAMCMSYESACGLDVPSWFELHHTEAHNRDIDRVLKLFERRFF